MHTQHEPLTRVDFPRLTPVRRALAIGQVAVSGINVSLILLLLGWPLTAFGYCVLEGTEIAAYQGKGLGALASAIHLRPIVCSYIVLASVLGGLKFWRSFRDVVLATVLLAVFLHVSSGEGGHASHGAVTEHRS